MILIFRYFFYKDYVGLSVWPFIILRETDLKQDAVLLNHERIHLRQQFELLILPFYLWYGIEWCVGMFKYGDSYQAYRNISFEKEAYAHEMDHAYLKKRRPFSFLRFLK
ncbi:hypothetical protein [Sediminicola luteus]|uniref:Peptidase M56 domain-containing protein n=1 Tax=Sediminicola luteus TaxID=319238 RepID=A0A2A4G9X2_9FLAO|nr:hypothetical protein [Sediminicola luteus]PCE65749.1 hypothetical protein B7P33_00130 [Sediminicola luteus]